MGKGRREKLLQKLHLRSRSHGSTAGSEEGQTEKQSVSRANESALSTSTLAVAPESGPSSPLEGSSETKTRSFWTQAYERLREEEPELVGRYLELLAGVEDSGIYDGEEQQIQIAAVVQRQREIMEKRQWKLVFWHREIVIREKIDHITQAFRIFKDIGSAVASLDSVHAGIPWAGVCALMQIVTSDSEQHAAVLDGLAFLTDLVNFYAQAEAFYLSQDVKPPIVGLYKLALEFQIMAAGYFARHTGIRVARNALLLDRWSQKLKEVKDKDAECRKWLDLSVSLQVAKKLESLSSAVIDTAVQALKILAWVSGISVRDQHIFVREYKLGQAYWGTGQWLIALPGFQQWFQAPAGIFHLEGGVGVGKSCLVSAVIEHCLKTADSRLAFFYCSRGKGNPFNSLDVLRSVLAQLCYTVDKKEIPQSIQKRYSERTSNVTGGSLCLTDCEKHIAELTMAGVPVTIIIDALDECPDYDELLSSLKKLYSVSPSIHIFLSGRPMHLSISDYFDQWSPFHVKVLDQTKEDIRSFIEKEIQSLERRRNSCIGKHPELEHKFRNALTQRAGGMFRWVELQLDLFLDKKKPIRHWKDFEAKLDRMLTDPSLPTLDKAYDDIYQSNVEPGSFGEATAIKSLRCVLSAFYPLTIQQLVEAVAISSDGEVDNSIDAAYVLDICNNFILVDASGVVLLAHLSVREYLEQKTLNGSHVKVFSSKLAHRQLAESCLTVMLLADLANTSIAKEVPDMLHYAVRCWLAHCEEAREERLSGSLHFLLKLFMNSKLTEWAELADEEFLNDPTRDQLWSISTVKPRAFVVCVWGLFEFFDSSIRLNNRLHDMSFYWQTPLELASYNGHLELVKRMVKTGPNRKTRHIISRALAASCSGGHADVAEFLLDVGADPNVALRPYSSFNFDKYTERRIGSTRTWFNSEVRPNMPYDRGYGSALQHACMGSNSPELAELLIARGADIDNPGGFVGSALQVASAEGHGKVVQYLLGKGADVNLGNDFFRSPLVEAANRNRYDMVQLLLEGGADPNVHSEFAGSALFWASFFLNFEMVELLLKHGANANSVQDEYSSALHEACEDGHFDIARILLDYGANVNARDCWSQIPLMNAVMEGRIEVVELLIERGADVNIIDEAGETALTLSARYGHTDVMQLLLARGADVETQGRLAYGWACEHGHDSIKKLLVENGYCPGAVHDTRDEDDDNAEEEEGKEGHEEKGEGGIEGMEDKEEAEEEEEGELKEFLALVEHQLAIAA